MFGHRNDTQNYCHLFLLCSLLLVALLAHGASCITRRRPPAPLARSQRQIITNELATGISGTGTSFNSIYSDPFLTQQQQQQQAIDDNDFPGSPGKTPVVQTNRNYGAGRSWRGFGSKVSPGGGYGVKGGGFKGGGFKGGSGRPPFYGASQY